MTAHYPTIGRKRFPPGQNKITTGLRQIVVTPSGMRLTREQWENRQARAGRYREGHRAELRLKARLRYHADVERSRERVRLSHRVHPQDPSTRRAWRERNSEALNARRRDYRAKNREKINMMEKRARMKRAGVHI